MGAWRGERMVRLRGQYRNLVWSPGRWTRFRIWAAKRVLPVGVFAKGVRVTLSEIDFEE